MNNTLDEILRDWHNWARGYLPVMGHGACSMFTSVKSSRQFDTENDATDGPLHNAQMKTVDFNIGELEPLYRSAIGISARNLATGRQVWTSARLPTDADELAEVMAGARGALRVRLVSAGVL